MHVRWTQPAADDLQNISDYTQDHFGPKQARKAALAIYEAAGALSASPTRGRAGRKAGTRETMVSGLPFVIVYHVRNNAIEIVRILHGAQRWP